MVKEKTARVFHGEQIEMLLVNCIFVDLSPPLDGYSIFGIWKSTPAHFCLVNVDGKTSILDGAIHIVDD